MSYEKRSVFIEIFRTHIRCYAMPLLTIASKKTSCFGVDVAKNGNGRVPKNAWFPYFFMGRVFGLIYFLNFASRVLLVQLYEVNYFIKAWEVKIS